MNISLNFSDLEEMILENSFPENYHFKGQPVTERVTIMDNFGMSGQFREIFFEGIHIAYGNLKLKHKTFIQFESDYETVEMHFDLSGHTTTQISNNRPYCCELTGNQHNIIYAPGIKGKFEFHSLSTEMLEINMSPAIFKKYVEGSELFKEFIDNINHQNPCLMGKHHMPITPAMRNLIFAILQCPKPGVYKKLFLESKVIELLLLQLEQFAAHNCVEFCTLKPADAKKIHHAKDLISNAIYKDHSLRKLALEIGTNEFTLKKGFKEIYGNTVFGTITDLRMEEAKLKLLSGKESISAISEQAGYKNSTHFIAAFKRKYGITPGKYKQEH